MEYRAKEIKSAPTARYEEAVACETPEKGVRANLGGLELRQFKEIEGWLFDCSSGK